MFGTYHGARFWCNCDGCGIICILCTWGMFLYSVYVVTFVLLRPLPFDECLTLSRIFNSIAFTGLTAMAVTAHVRTMLTNPGAVPRHATPIPVARSDSSTARIAGDEESPGDVETSRLTSRGERGNEGPSTQTAVVKWCHKCDAFKPPRAHHCSLCQRCIVKMDHHCPWVNNCVGIGNQKLFLLFCAYTCALCVYALAIMAAVMVAVGEDDQIPACRLSSTDHVCTVGLATISIMFGLFTLCMACDQCQVASTNQTKIDRLKGELHETTAGGPNEVFGGVPGERCRCHWIMPVPARFPAGDAAAKILGYCIGRTTRISSLDSTADEIELTEQETAVPHGLSSSVSNHGGFPRRVGADVSRDGYGMVTAEGTSDEEEGIQESFQ